MLWLDEHDLDFCHPRISPILARKNLSRLAVTAIQQLANGGDARRFAPRLRCQTGKFFDSVRCVCAGKRPKLNNDLRTAAWIGALPCWEGASAHRCYSLLSAAVSPRRLISVHSSYFKKCVTSVTTSQLVV